MGAVVCLACTAWMDQDFRHYSAIALVQSGEHKPVDSEFGCLVKTRLTSSFCPELAKQETQILKCSPFASAPTKICQKHDQLDSTFFSRCFVWGMLFSDFKDNYFLVRRIF